MMNNDMCGKVDLNIMCDQGELVLRSGNAKPVYDFQGEQYKTDTLESFVTLVKAKAVKDHAVIFQNQDRALAILDDRIQNRDKDSIRHERVKTTQFLEWEEVVRTGKVFSQREFMDFLKRRREHEIPDGAMLLEQIKNFKFVTNITGDFTYDTRNNYTFSVRVGESEGTVRIPQIIYVQMEIFKGSNFEKNMELELEIKKPTSEKERPLFALTCPKYPRYLEEAIEHEGQRLIKQLEGWLVVEGEAR